MTVYISRDESDALAHYGVMGMKWGVRHDREKSIGKLNKKIQTTSNKISKSNRNIEKYNLRDPLSRYANDVRITRQKHLKATLANRQAKLAYLKNPSAQNKKTLSETRGDRATNILTTVAAGAPLKGSYNRYRASGNTVVESTLKSYGTHLLRSAAVTTASGVLGGAAGVGLGVAYSIGVLPASALATASTIATGAATGSAYGAAAVPSLVGRRVHKSKSKSHKTYLTRENQRYGTNKIGLRKR